MGRFFKTTLVLAAIGLFLPTLAQAKTPKRTSTTWVIKAKIADSLNKRFHQPAKRWTARDVKIRTKRLPWTGMIGGPVQRDVKFKANKGKLRYQGSVRATTPLNPMQNHMTTLSQLAFTLQPRSLGAKK